MFGVIFLFITVNYFTHLIREIYIEKSKVWISIVIATLITFLILNISGDFFKPFLYF
jgi:hypothetical protein